MTFVVHEVRAASDKLPFTSTQSWFVCDVAPCKVVLRADSDESDIPLGWTALLDAKMDRVRHGCCEDHTSIVRAALIGHRRKK